jgi:hypothetical protein
MSRASREQLRAYADRVLALEPKRTLMPVTLSKAPRRILTAARGIVGTDATVDLRQRNIAARLGKETPCY